MTSIIDTKPKRHLSAKIAAGLAISAVLLLGTFVAGASANDYQNNHGWNDNYQRVNNNWGGHYYDATPYYYPQYRRGNNPMPFNQGNHTLWRWPDGHVTNGKNN